MNIKLTDPLQAVQELRAELVAIHPCLKNYPVNDTQALVDIVVPFVVEKESAARRAGYVEGGRAMLPLLAALANEKVCSYIMCNSSACRCCHQSAYKWGSIKHLDSCDVLAAIRALPVSGTVNVCSLCGEPTDHYCDDCKIDLGTIVYVCNKLECRDQHVLKSNVKSRPVSGDGGKS